jgi:pantoate--beta-alanine ligase
VATFGQKDYQQWRVLAQMTRDLDLPVEVVGCPTVREPDGLALSSRNRYLEAGERARATALYAGLCRASTAYAQGERDPAALERIAREPVEAAADRIDYVVLRHAETLAPFEGAVNASAVVLMAVHVGSTRLIDNLVLENAQT